MEIVARSQYSYCYWSVSTRVASVCYFDLRQMDDLIPRLQSTVRSSLTPTRINFDEEMSESNKRPHSGSPSGSSPASKMVTSERPSPLTYSGNADDKS